MHGQIGAKQRTSRSGLPQPLHPPQYRPRRTRRSFSVHGFRNYLGTYALSPRHSTLIHLDLYFTTVLVLTLCDIYLGNDGSLNVYHCAKGPLAALEEHIQGLSNRNRFFFSLAQSALSIEFNHPVPRQVIKAAQHRQEDLSYCNFQQAQITQHDLVDLDADRDHHLCMIVTK